MPGAQQPSESKRPVFTAGDKGGKWTRYEENAMQDAGAVEDPPKRARGFRFYLTIWAGTVGARQSRRHSLVTPLMLWRLERRWAGKKRANKAKVKKRVKSVGQRGAEQEKMSLPLQDFPISGACCPELDRMARSRREAARQERGRTLGEKSTLRRGAIQRAFRGGLSTSAICRGVRLVRVLGQSWG